MTIAHWFRTQAISSPLCQAAAGTAQAEWQQSECIAENVSLRTGCIRRGIQIKLSCSLPHTALRIPVILKEQQPEAAGELLPAVLIWMAVSNPNPHLTTIQGGYCLCWETNDVKHLLENMSTGCNKPSLQTSTGAHTPITLLVGASQLFFYDSKEALLNTSSRQGEWDAKRRKDQTVV